MRTKDSKAGKLSTKPLGAASLPRDLVRVRSTNVAEVRRLIGARLARTGTFPSRPAIIEAGAAEGYEVTPWYYRAIVRDLKETMPQLWSLMRPNARNERELRKLRSKVTPSEQNLHRIFADSLDIDETEVVSVLLRVVAHATTRGVLPLTQLVTMARATTESELALFGEILKSVNLADL